MPSLHNPQGMLVAAAGGPQFNVPLAPRNPIRYCITGVTKDSVGVALGGCTVEVYETIPGINPRTMEPTGRFVGSAVSDTDGNYNVCVHSTPGATFQAKAYKQAGPDVAGVTVNTLTATVT